MNIPENVLRKDELIVLKIRELLSNSGFSLFTMNQFEDYDFYAQNKDFLMPGGILTFTDANGRLKALKPDVTLSIIRSRRPQDLSLSKVYYNERVYRSSARNESFKEIPQMGAECIGPEKLVSAADMLLLAAKSLRLISEDMKLGLTSLEILSKLVSDLALPAQVVPSALECIRQKNLHQLQGICSKEGANEAAMEQLLKVLSVSGAPATVFAALKKTEVPKVMTDRLLSVCTVLEDSGFGDSLFIDFSQVSDLNYYNGIVFSGFVSGIAEPVLAGGQYDNLMRRMGSPCSAAGFAIYLDRLEKLSLKESVTEEEDPILTIALPKGRLGEKVLAQLEEAGYPCPEMKEENRKLVFENKEAGVRYFWAKPSDVPIYVERGTADLGIAGKDILLEYEPDVYEMMDLDIGKCRMMVAAKQEFEDKHDRTLRVATKFANIAEKHFASQGRQIDIIHLNGSIEIAPVLGMSDVIVDIVETGKTLKENNLEVKEIIAPISARLIVNKAGYLFKQEQTDRLIENLRQKKGESND